MKISVIVPVYNTKAYLKRCLDSLVNQTLDNIEIIVINDGSKENVDSIIEKYKDKIKYFENDNHGIGYTRNFGISKATGEYIGFVDSDDYVSIDMYKEYYDFAIKNNLDMVVADYYRCMDNKADITKITDFPIGNIYNNAKILIDLDYGPCNKIFKRDTIIQNNILFEENLKYEDLPFVLKALKHSKRVGHIDKAYYHYNVRSASETTTIDKRSFDIFEIFDIVVNYLRDDDIVKKELEYLIVSKLLDYNIIQRNQKNSKLRNKFIDRSFAYISEHFPDYKKNEYLRKENIIKRIIKQNKIITKLYCQVYPK